VGPGAVLEFRPMKQDITYSSSDETDDNHCNAKINDRVWI
jgi:hypothetical protein